MEVTTDPEAWSPTCVICAAKGRERKLDHGHCCAACRTRIDDDLRDVLDLCAQAAAWVAPRSTGSGTRGVPGSRPPINVDAVDPWLTIVRLDTDDPSSEVTILEMLEAWERVIREDRRLAPFGPASAARDGGTTPTGATISGVVDFLRRQIDWITTDPEFGLDDFADQVRRARRALNRWDADKRDDGAVIRCPSFMDNGAECGHWLRFHVPRTIEDNYEPADLVTCPRCQASRSAETLVLVAMSDGRAEVWVDSEATARQFGVSEHTLRLWGRRGVIQTDGHGRYGLASVSRAIHGETA